MYQSALWNYHRQDLTCQNCENQVYLWENYPKTAEIINFLDIPAHWMNILLLSLDIFISVNSWSTRVPFTTIVGRTKPVKIAKIRLIYEKITQNRPKWWVVLIFPHIGWINSFCLWIFAFLLTHEVPESPSQPSETGLNL